VGAFGHGLTSRRSQPPLVLAVPLSRFTSRVGGGSALFVRHLRDTFMSDPSSENAQQRNEAIYEFTDRIVSIAIGLLALSVTFRNSVIGSHPQAAWLIKTTWVACAVSGIFGMVWRFSKITVLHSITVQLASGNRVAGAAPHFYQLVSLWICIIGFVVGILSLTVFGFLNI